VVEYLHISIFFGFSQAFSNDLVLWFELFVRLMENSAIAALRL
jgi:hypothetical protein